MGAYFNPSVRVLTRLLMISVSASGGRECGEVGNGKLKFGIFFFGGGACLSFTDYLTQASISFLLRLVSSSLM